VIYLELIFQHLAGRNEETCRPSVMVNGKYQKYKILFLKERIEKLTKWVQLTR